MSFLDLFRPRQARIESKSYNVSYQTPSALSFTAKWSQYSDAQALDAYRKSVWLYDCVSLRANNLASVPWVVEVKSAGEWVEPEAHELADLLAAPNPYIDFLAMMKRAIYWLDLSGDAWFLKVRNGTGRVYEWWPLLPDSMRVIRGGVGAPPVVGWKYQDGLGRKTYPAEDIVHLMYTGPGSIYYGLSPLQAAANSVDIDQEAANFQKVSLQNFGMPPGVFEGPIDLTQDQYEQGKKWVEEQSGPEDAHKPWILGGFKWQSMAQTPHELDFWLSRKETAKEILSAYATPPPMVGIYDSAGGLNSEIIQTARKIFWTEGLIPILQELQSQLNLQLASEWGTDVRLAYDLTNVEAMQEDRAAKIIDAKGLWSMGVPLTEINRLLDIGLDMDEIPGSDKGYLGSGLLPTDFDVGEPEPEPEPIGGINGDQSD